MLIITLQFKPGAAEEFFRIDCGISTVWSDRGPLICLVNSPAVTPNKPSVFAIKAPALHRVSLRVLTPIASEVSPTSNITQQNISIRFFCFMFFYINECVARVIVFAFMCGNSWKH